MACHKGGARDGINAMGPVRLMHTNENASFGVFPSPRNTSKKARIDCGISLSPFPPHREDLAQLVPLRVQPCVQLE